MATGDFDQIITLNPGWNDVLNASRDPTVNDDNQAGQGGMSWWINMSDPDVPRVFQCLSGTIGAAIWVQIGG